MISGLNKLMHSRGPADCSGTQFWPLCQFRSGAETGNDFRSLKPNPGINPEPNKPSTLHQPVCRRHRSGANLQTRHWSGVETATESGRRIGYQPKDILFLLCEERRKKDNLLGLIIMKKEKRWQTLHIRKIAD